MSTTLFTYGLIALEEDQKTRKFNQLQLPTQPKQFTINAIIIEIACGCSHFLALSDQGIVYSYGSNQFGQRGTNDNQLNLRGITQIAAGSYHSVAITRENGLYAWGRGFEGQLGLGSADCVEEPTLLEIRAQKVYCGGFHTIVIDKYNEAYSCGDNSYGQLGIGSDDASIKQFESILLSHIIEIAAGHEHTLFIDKQRQVYACGNNLFSQCGFEEQNSNYPIRLNFVADRIYASIFSAAIVEGQLYVWGTGKWGYSKRPMRIDVVEDLQMGDEYGIVKRKGEQLILGQSQEKQCSLERAELAEGEVVKCGYKVIVVGRYQKGRAQERQSGEQVYREQIRRLEETVAEQKSALEEKESQIEYLQEELRSCKQKLSEQRKNEESQFQIEQLSPIRKVDDLTMTTKQELSICNRQSIAKNEEYLPRTYADRIKRNSVTEGLVKQEQFSINLCRVEEDKVKKEGQYVPKGYRHKENAIKEDEQSTQQFKEPEQLEQQEKQGQEVGKFSKMVSMERKVFPHRSDSKNYNINTNILDKIQSYQMNDPSRAKHQRTLSSGLDYLRKANPYLRQTLR